MRRVFLLLSSGVAVLGFLAWIFTGAHTGWTQTQIPQTGVDEITGIEFTRYEEGLRLGVEFLGVSFLLAAILAGLAFIFKNNRNL